MAAVTLQHPFLCPLIILTLPPVVLLGQNSMIALVLALAGLTGMIRGKQILVTTASLSLLVALVWGKTAAHLLKTAPLDTAVLLLEFTTVLILMEASSVVLSFHEDYGRLMGKRDEFSAMLRARLQAWLQHMLGRQGKLGLAAVAISAVLLPVAGITSIPSNQLVFTATLALLAVIVLLFLAVHRREP